MPLRCQQITVDVRRIWEAGVGAVTPDRLIPKFVAVDGQSLRIGNAVIDLNRVGRIALVGGGKAAAGMATSVARILGVNDSIAGRVFGWVNVPDGDYRASEYVHIHSSRRRGVNEPTAAAVDGTRRILRIVKSLGPRDVCICLLSGGASALLPAPIPGLSLSDKVAITQQLSAAGATIFELNEVRRALSEIKGGGLAASCGAGKLFALILSDVLDDNIETIASGPTSHHVANPTAAIELLQQFCPSDSPALQRALQLLARRTLISSAPGEHSGFVSTRNSSCQVTNIVIGNNPAAVEAAAAEARRIGYRTEISAMASGTVSANSEGNRLTSEMRKMGISSIPQCRVSGGEPIVKLAPLANRGRGGRNQQLCLAAAIACEDWRGGVLLSGGTDGEDGPTDAAGAWVNEDVVNQIRHLRIDTIDSLARNNAYSVFEATESLLKTGLTGTNVCDLRVIATAGDC